MQDGNHGAYRPRREEIVTEGTPHIRAADISDAGDIDFLGAQKISETALARIGKGVGAIGDVLLTHKGTVGRVARVPATAPHFVCSPQTTFWRSLDHSKLDPAFLYAYLRSPEFTTQLHARMHDTDMAPYVSLTAQRSLSVLLPPKEDQYRIGVILITLDDKIESNRRVSSTIQAAMWVLHRWHRRTASRSVPLARLTAVIRRGITPRYIETGGVMVLNQRCIRNDSLQFASARRHDDRIKPVDDRGIQVGDMLVNSTGVGTLGRVARVGRLPEKSVTVDSHVTVVRAAPEMVAPAYLAADLMARQNELAELGEGSTGQTELSRKRLASVEIALPSDDAQREFSVPAEACWALQAGLEEEVETLEALRDALLPKLISGEIRVPDTADPEEVIGPAAEALAEARA